MEEKEINKAEGVVALRNIFGDMLKYMPSKLIGVLGNILIVPIYSNLLTPEQYGLYSISIATLSFLCIIFFDWIGTSGLRFFNSHNVKGDISQYFSSLLGILGINFFLMFMLSFIFRSQITGFFKIPVHYLYFITILIIPVAFRSLLFQIVRAQIRPGIYTIYTIVNQFLTIATAICLIKFLHWGAFSILAAMASSILIIDLILISIVKIFSGFSFKNIQFGILLKFCYYGLPLMLASLSNWIMNQSNKFIIQHYEGSFYNGIVGVSYNMTYSIFLTMYAIIMIATMPRILMMYESKINPQNTISRLSGYFIILTLPFTVLISLYAADYVHFMANPKFAQAVILVPFLLVAAFFTGLTDYTTIQYHLTQKTYITTIIRFIPGLIGIYLNVRFIPEYGLWAVGWTTLITNVLYFLLSVVIISDKKLYWKIPFADIRDAVISLACAGGFVYAMKTYHPSVNPITQMLLSILIYFIVFVIIRRDIKALFMK